MIIYCSDLLTPRPGPLGCKVICPLGVTRLMSVLKFLAQMILGGNAVQIQRLALKRTEFIGGS